MAVRNRKIHRLGVALLSAACALLVRDVEADAPAGHFTVDDRLVVDTKTKLTWERIVGEELLSLHDAAGYCADLDLLGNGWRLPTIKELHTLVDETRTVPAIDTSVFPDTPPTFFWTSTRVASFNQYLWSVNFSEGTDAWFPADALRFVRCVR